MSLILNIDTTSDNALVNIAENGTVLKEEVNSNPKDHAAFVHLAIQSVLNNLGIFFHNLTAVAVCHGPGSYTGIRVGMATAKGICYAADKPLITVNQLEILTKDVIDNSIPGAVLYCPMIDARRMEVFTAMYDYEMNEVVAPSALVLQHNSYQDFLSKGKIMFYGSGASKWQQLCIHENAFFAAIACKGSAFAKLSYSHHQCERFVNVAHVSPLYVKDFYTPHPGNT